MVPAASNTDRRCCRDEPFLSTLTVSQFAFVRQAGVEPLTAVMGCDVRWLSVELPLPAPPPKRTGGVGGGLGFPSMASRYDGDVVGVPQLDDQFAEARRVVRARLTTEARAAGANLVIGVGHQQRPVASQTVAADMRKLVLRSTRRHPRFSRPLELQLIGTAAHDPDASDDTVQLSTLSASEFAQLRAAGWRPAGIVGGTGHAFGGQLWAGVVARELVADSAVWETARQTAMQQLMDEATTLGADGVIGLSVDVQQHTIDWTRQWSSGSTELKSSLVGVTAIATAICRSTERAATAPTPTRMLLLR
jgi:uncharacterized protein YbjQ (UPF0145 family)